MAHLPPAAIAFALAFFVSASAAQDPSTGSGQAYPAKPIKLIVPYKGAAQALADTPAQSAAFLAAGHAKWGRVVRESGAKVD